jgi:phage gpG-like protein
MAGAGLEVKFKDFDKVQEALKNASHPRMYDLANDGAEELEERSRQTFDAGKDVVTGDPWARMWDGSASHLHRRGALQNSIAHEAYADGSAIIGSNLEYARIHNEGGTTKAHEIIPRRAKAISFWGSNGRVFAKKVNHPGSVIPRRRFLGVPNGWVEDYFSRPETAELLGLGE